MAEGAERTRAQAQLVALQTLLYTAFGTPTPRASNAAPALPNVLTLIQTVVQRARRALELVCARLAHWRLAQQRLLVWSGYEAQCGGEPARQASAHEQLLVSIESQCAALLYSLHSPSLLFKSK